MDDVAETSPRDDTSREGPHSGLVEVDETYVGGVEEQRRGGRQRDSNKSIVIAAVEVRGRGSGRIRLAVVEDFSAASLVPFVEASVAPGSTLLVDGWQGYAPLHKTYDYRPTTVGDAKNASKLFPRVHRTFSNLKTWPKGTHHGVSSKHLPHYVIRVSVQSPPHANGRISVAAEPHGAARADYLQDVVHS